MTDPSDQPSAPHASRLDGLLGLLASGSSPALRRMAATQLADLVASHPLQTAPILARIRAKITAPGTDWDTRVAISTAFGSIAEATPAWLGSTPASDLKAEEAKEDVAEEESSRLSFEKLDVARVLEHGAPLLASSGAEFRDSPTVDVARQRRQLAQDLGIGSEFPGSGSRAAAGAPEKNAFKDSGEKEENMLGLDDDDLIVRHDSLRDEEDAKKEAVTGLVDDLTGLSARERNKVKREAKRRKKFGMDDAVTNPPKRRTKTQFKGVDPEPETKDEDDIAKLEPEEQANAAEDLDLDAADMGETDEWVFQPTCEALKQWLFHPRWEVRHGAAIGLREILKRDIGAAGRFACGEQGERENSEWVMDLACRILCVLALDRFGDFVGDGVVAPVRESAAMLLGVLSRGMNETGVKSLLRVLVELYRNQATGHWEARQSALLGVRYVIAVREDLSDLIIPLVLDTVFEGMNDFEDDVRAVAAEAMFPITKSLVRICPQDVSRLVAQMWDLLLELDDLSSSTKNVLNLLVAFSKLEPPPGIPKLWLSVEPGTPDESESLIPRIYPFLRHTSVAVRRAAILAVDAVFDIVSADTQEVIQLGDTLIDRLYRNIILEIDKKTLETSRDIFDKLCQCLMSATQDKSHLASMITSKLPRWFDLACHDSRAAAYEFDKGQRPADNPQGKRSIRRFRSSRQKSQPSGIPSMITEDSVISGALPADDGDKMQLSAAETLGLLTKILRDTSELEKVLMHALGAGSGMRRRFACYVSFFWARWTSIPECLMKALSNEVVAATSCSFEEIVDAAIPFFSDLSALIKVYSEVRDPPRPFLDSSSGFSLEMLRSLVSEGAEMASGNNIGFAVQRASELQNIATDLATTGFSVWESTNPTKARKNAVSSLKMRVLVSSGYLASKRTAISCSLCSSAASAIVGSEQIPLPKLVSPFIKGLMNAVKTLESEALQDFSAASLAQLAKRLSERSSAKPLSLVVKNLCNFLVSSSAAGESTTLEITKPDEIQRRGAKKALCSIAASFGRNVFAAIPQFWDAITLNMFSSNPNESAVVESLLILRETVASFSSELQGDMTNVLKHIIATCSSESDRLTIEAGRCLAQVVDWMPMAGMTLVVKDLLPRLSENISVASRLGLTRAVQLLVETMDLKIVPYASLLVLPMMSKMVDKHEEIRKACSAVFGTLVRLIPLEEGTDAVDGFDQALKSEREDARDFLGQLLGTRPRNPYPLPIQIDGGIELRHYQQECLDWLGFLNRYGLHGALCDDMGLGKTLMTLSIMAGDCFNMQERDKVRHGQSGYYPSLVLAPATVVAHWHHEAERFFGSYLQPVIMYSGTPKERRLIKGSRSFSEANLVLTSYEIVGNELESFEGINWNYVVLDEGHVIKNAKTKISKAVRRLNSKHRLLLSGTPIQNSVLDLWSLFDFLMPGFLGSESEFKDQFGKPIMKSKDPKCTDKDREKGMVALESLHRQVLPFVLRRLKDDVLDELPPKIIQDFSVTMTPLQTQLYHDFSKIIEKKGLPSDEKEDADVSSSGKETHVFQAIRYLQKLCSHPKMVVGRDHPQYPRIQRFLQSQGQSLDDIEMSPKLCALRDILQESGIGNEELGFGKSTGGHRVLIFAQVKEMLDLVETDLFRKHMPGVTFLRLDGTVAVNNRFSIVTRFNADPSIDCLLLTTQVGGLGLNLTGADTVIFLEHDWNPTKDLQAMDRAHRLGQKKTVNVYRIITKDTLEEKIMGIQSFKTHIANTVVNRENASLQTMKTSELLNLFGTEGKTEDASRQETDVGPVKGIKAAVEGMEELWSEDQYTDEYNMDDFLKSLK